MPPNQVLVGTCGWGMAQRRYYAQFPLVELQQTFYRLVRPETAARYRQQAPAGFCFTLKAFQGITHPGTSPTYRRSNLKPQELQQVGFFRDTPLVRRSWEHTRRLAQVLEAPVVLLQCPRSFRPDAENLRQLGWFLDWANRDGFLLAWEVRGPEWTDQVVADVCCRHGLIHAVDPFVRPPVTDPPQYFRLHGIGGYRYRFTDEDLDRLQQWCRRGPTWCLFNNARMTEDARRFWQRWHNSD